MYALPKARQMARYPENPQSSEYKSPRSRTEGYYSLDRNNRYHLTRMNNFLDGFFGVYLPHTSVTELTDRLNGKTNFQFEVLYFLTQILPQTKRYRVNQEGPFVVQSGFRGEGISFLVQQQNTGNFAWQLTTHNKQLPDTFSHGLLSYDPRVNTLASILNKKLLFLKTVSTYLTFSTAVIQLGAEHVVFQDNVFKIFSSAGLIGVTYPHHTFDVLRPEITEAFNQKHAVKLLTHQGSVVCLTDSIIQYVKNEQEKKFPFYVVLLREEESAVQFVKFFPEKMPETLNELEVALGVTDQ